MVLFGAVVVAILAAGPVAAADLVGKARVVDGDTLEIAGRFVQIFAVDAPEERQTCDSRGLEWPCGTEAIFALAREVAGAWVVCEDRGRDEFSRMVGKCRVGDYDLGATLVRAGWAVAAPAAPMVYAAEEAAAREERLGMWQGTFAPPWTWRALWSENEGQFTIHMEGSPGIEFAADCWLSTGPQHEWVRLTGLVPATHAFTAEAISCHVAKFGGAGVLDVRLERNGISVSQSETEAPSGGAVVWAR